MDEQTYHVVCALDGPSQWDDNVKTVCAECGAKIMHRPNVPSPRITVCIGCAFAAMNAAEDAGDPVEVVTTPEQRAEMEALHGPGAIERGIAAAEKYRRMARHRSVQ